MYFQITVINGNQFVIEETKEKKIPHGLALSTLKQIQRIFENQMRYCQIEEDAYSKLPLSHLYHHLQKQAEMIHTRFIEKALRVSICFGRRIRLERTQVRKVFFQIRQQQPFPFPSAIIQKMLGYLTIKELFVFSRINHQARKEADSTFLLRACRLGSTSEKKEGPKQFAISLRKEVLSLQEKGLIPEDYQGNHWESILANLKSISSEEILAIFSHPDIYKEKCPFFIRYLLKNTKRTGACDELRTLGVNGLILSIQHNQRETAALLFFHGALLNGRDVDGFTPLAVAVRQGKAEIVRFFLKRKAKPDLADTNGNTPLHWAASLGFDEIVEILLEFKADPSISNHNGKNPFSLGLRYPQVRACLERIS